MLGNRRKWGPRHRRGDYKVSNGNETRALLKCKRKWSAPDFSIPIGEGLPCEHDLKSSTQPWMKIVWAKELFPQNQTTLHKCDDVAKSSNHREIGEHEAADNVRVVQLSRLSLLYPAGKDVANRLVVKATLPTIAAITV